MNHPRRVSALLEGRIQMFNQPKDLPPPLPAARTRALTSALNNTPSNPTLILTPRETATTTTTTTTTTATTTTTPTLSILSARDDAIQEDIDSIQDTEKSDDVLTQTNITPQKKLANKFSLGAQNEIDSLQLALKSTQQQTQTLQKDHKSLQEKYRALLASEKELRKQLMLATNELSRVQQATECLICMSRLASVITFPCRHQLMCQPCFRSITRNGSELSSQPCPKCRRPIDDAVHVMIENPEFHFFSPS
eukprot:TRINITY_DN668_c0_g1_i1.p2 TRINITY_DN668_c0_g1~~TRINITY_DN668_c0_g1_i1.p2  ORF type:complete len:269 (+),score=48.93 TRINITY_DN668_c0_g1_i1:55-807(+)